MAHRVHHGLRHLTKQQPSRNPLLREADAFALLIWVIAVAIVVALAARYVGLAGWAPLLVVGLAAIARFYFGLGKGAGRPRRKRRPYRGPSTKRRRHQGK